MDRAAKRQRPQAHGTEQLDDAAMGDMLRWAAIALEEDKQEARLTERAMGDPKGKGGDPKGKGDLKGKGEIKGKRGLFIIYVHLYVVDVFLFALHELAGSR